MDDSSPSPKRNFISEVLTEHLKTTSIEDLKVGIGICERTLRRLHRGEMSAIQMKTIQKFAAYFEWGPEEAGMAVWYSDQLMVAKKKKRKRKAKGEPT